RAVAGEVRRLGGASRGCAAGGSGPRLEPVHAARRAGRGPVLPRGIARLRRDGRAAEDPVLPGEGIRLRGNRSGESVEREGERGSAKGFTDFVRRIHPRARRAHPRLRPTNLAGELRVASVPVFPSEKPPVGSSMFPVPLFPSKKNPGGLLCSGSG